MKKNPQAKVTEAPAQDGLREFVFYLEKLEHPEKIGFNGITRTIWAKSAEEATERMKKSWGEQMGYSVRYLHPMDEFLAEAEKEKQLEKLNGESNKQFKPKAKEIESENV